MKRTWLFVLPWAVVVSSCPKSEVRDKSTGNTIFVVASCQEHIGLAYKGAQSELITFYGSYFNKANIELLKDIAFAMNEAHEKRVRP